MAGLLDFLQSASNASASTVSGPVDMLAWLLQKAGVPVGNAPPGGSAWMEQKGLTKPVKQSAASLAGETVGLLSPTVAAAKAPQIAKGLLQVADNAAAPQLLNKQRGIFMGDLSKTWDKAAADKAMAMEKAGADPRAIWKETGTFKGVDGKWRQEIDDSAAKMSGAIDYAAEMQSAYKAGGIPAMHKRQDELLGYEAPYLRRGGTRELNDVVSHRAMIDAYPDIMYGTKYQASDSPVIGEGAFYPASNTIELSRANEPTARSGLLHELQHVVQDRQGFASGGSPDMQSIQSVAKSIYDDNIGQFSGSPRQLMEMARHNAYKRLAGEAEARAVQKRMNLTPAERRALFPLDSYDVPLDKLIVR